MQRTKLFQRFKRETVEEYKPMHIPDSLIQPDEPEAIPDDGVHEPPVAPPATEPEPEESDEETTATIKRMFEEDDEPELIQDIAVLPREREGLRTLNLTLTDGEYVQLIHSLNYSYFDSKSAGRARILKIQDKIQKAGNRGKSAH